MGAGEAIESLKMLIKAQTTTPQDRSSQAHPGQAALRSTVAAAASCWGDTVPALKDLPAAAANRATGHELYFQGMACLSECTKASMLYPLTNQPLPAVSAQHGTHSRPGTADTPALVPFKSHKYLVEDLKVCMTTNGCM